MMKINFLSTGSRPDLVVGHLKIAIGIIVVFELLLGFAMWTPIKVRYYTRRLDSSGLAVRAEAVREMRGLRLKEKPPGDTTWGRAENIPCS